LGYTTGGYAMQAEIQPEVVFKTRLQALMKQRGMIQSQVAKQFGVSQAAVSKWVNGTIPDHKILMKLAVFFDVTADSLLGIQRPVIDSAIHSTSFVSGTPIELPPPLKNLKISSLECADRTELREIAALLTEAAKRLERLAGGKM
jgi:transcriptional regulator with XRE-family HTH domain